MYLSIIKLRKSVVHLNIHLKTNYEPACLRQGISDFQHTFTFPLVLDGMLGGSLQSEQIDVF